MGSVKMSVYSVCIFGCNFWREQIKKIQKKKKIVLKLGQHQAQIQGHVQQGQSNERGIPLNIARYKKRVYSIVWVQFALIACCVSLVVFIVPCQKEKYTLWCRQSYPLLKLVNKPSSLLLEDIQQQQQQQVLLCINLSYKSFPFLRNVYSEYVNAVNNQNPHNVLKTRLVLRTSSFFPLFLKDDSLYMLL